MAHTESMRKKRTCSVIGRAKEKAGPYRYTRNPKVRVEGALEDDCS
jgi:Asp-tRNA(Asn)/Glu-tRNA(Gln) amidotransferase B subunit